MNTDEIVESLQAYGVVRIHQSEERKTFMAKAHLFMHGMKAEVSSEFGHPTLLSAMIELQRRVFDLVGRGDMEQIGHTDILEKNK